MSVLSETIGNKIRRIRTQKPLTQEEIADKLCMTAAGFGKIERGETDITLKKLEQICEVLDISVFQMLSIDEKTNIFNVKDTTQGVIGQHINNYQTEKNETILKLIETLQKELQEKNNIITQLLKTIQSKN